MENKYREDILHEGFEQRTMYLNDDYEGSVTCTLVRRRSSINSVKAVLYIHGFNDYFFQKELAYRFNDNGFHFYALDLRKYGRSYLPHQKFNDTRSLKSYYEDILETLNIIHEEKNSEVLLMGHSTGGLILTLFAKDFSGKEELFHGILLNSPFYEFNINKVERLFIPLISSIGRFLPSIKIAGGFTEAYGKSIHHSYDGEWEYDLRWKPNIAPKVNFGWIRAIYSAQRELSNPFEIKQPVLVMHSDRSATDLSKKEQLSTRDVILNVEDIKQIAGNIRGDVQISAIAGGLHDLILSKKPVRENSYSIIFRWIESHLF